MPDSPAVTPPPIQAPLRLLLSEDEAISAIAQMIGKAAARRWLAEKSVGANTKAAEARETAR